MSVYPFIAAEKAAAGKRREGLRAAVGLPFRLLPVVDPHSV